MTERVYRVNDLYATLQCEGSRTGTPMVLLRLQGCGVGCPWCDTRETWPAGDGAGRVDSLAELLEIRRKVGTTTNWTTATAEELAMACARLAAPGIRWVLLTGGEPAEQDLRELVEAVHAEGMLIALETSGTAGGFIGAGLDWVTVSPKVGMRRPLSWRAVPEADELKFVVGKSRDVNAAVEMVEGLRREFPACRALAEGRQFLAPLSLSRNATELCVSAAQRLGWRVSFQIHRYIGLR